jgi:hypothetical protein
MRADRYWMRLSRFTSAVTPPAACVTPTCRVYADCENLAIQSLEPPARSRRVNRPDHGTGGYASIATGMASG